MVHHPRSTPVGGGVSSDTPHAAPAPAPAPAAAATLRGRPPGWGEGVAARRRRSPVRGAHPTAPPARRASPRRPARLPPTLPRRQGVPTPPVRTAVAAATRSTDRRDRRGPNRMPNSWPVGQQPNKRPSVGRPVRATEPEQNAILSSDAVCHSREPCMCQELMSVSAQICVLNKKRELRGAWHVTRVLLSSQFWPMLSMSRRVINCAKLFLSHRFSRIKSFDQWAVDRDAFLTSTTSTKIGKTAIDLDTNVNTSCRLSIADPRILSWWTETELRTDSLHQSEAPLGLTWSF